MIEFNRKQIWINAIIVTIIGIRLFSNVHGIPKKMFFKWVRFLEAVSCLLHPLNKKAKSHYQIPKVFTLYSGLYKLLMLLLEKVDINGIQQ